nr:hypothetical protein [Nocardia zapadnayensis]
MPAAGPVATGREPGEVPAVFVANMRAVVDRYAARDPCGSP